MTTDYRPLVERAIRHIGEHLAEPLAVSDIARVAHLSEFHFHRIFSAVTGEPVGRFVTRKRLELAAMRLAYEPDRSITDIALSSGYSSSSNFTKAFAAYFGCPPSRVRKPLAGLPGALGELTRERRDVFDPTLLYTVPPDDESARRSAYEALSRDVRFETCDAIEVVCLASPEGYDYEALENTWRDLIRRVREIGVTDGPVDAYGLAFDSPYITAPEKCRYHACVPCAPGLAVVAPLFRAAIPAGRYAVFRYAGPIDGVDGMYRRIYSAWLPMSSVRPDDFVAVAHYDHDWPADGQVDLEIRIKVIAK